MDDIDLLYTTLPQHDLSTLNQLMLDGGVIWNCPCGMTPHRNYPTCPGCGHPSTLEILMLPMWFGVREFEVIIKLADVNHHILEVTGKPGKVEFLSLDTIDGVHAVLGWRLEVCEEDEDEPVRIFSSIWPDIRHKKEN